MSTKDLPLRKDVPLSNNLVTDKDLRQVKVQPKVSVSQEARCRKKPGFSA
jgi:hypothetical protein